MSLSNFCCTLLKFYSQSWCGAICFPSVDCAQLLSGEWAQADVLRWHFYPPTGLGSRSPRGADRPCEVGPPETVLCPRREKAWHVRGGTLNTFSWALSVFQSCSIFLFGQKRVLILLSRKPRGLEDSLRAPQFLLPPPNGYKWEFGALRCESPGVPLAFSVCGWL